MNTIPGHDRFAPVKRFALLATIVLASVASAGLIIQSTHANGGVKAWHAKSTPSSSDRKPTLLTVAANVPLEYIR